MEADGTCFEIYTTNSVRPHSHMNVVDAAMKESVSFGRFLMDDFSWVRRSSFNHNPHLEEVGSCSTPGSVAQKKAYFEAYYARKKTVERARAEEGSSVVVQGEKYKETGKEEEDDDDDDDDDESTLVKGYEYLSVPQNMESTSTMTLIPSLPMKSVNQGFLHTHGHPFPVDSIKKHHREAMEEPKKALSVVGNKKVANSPLKLRRDKDEEDDVDDESTLVKKGYDYRSVPWNMDRTPTIASISNPPTKSDEEGFLHAQGHPFTIDSIEKHHSEAIEERKKGHSVFSIKKATNNPLDLRKEKNDDDDNGDDDVDESFNGIVEQSLACVLDNEPPNMVEVPFGERKLSNTKASEIKDKFKAPNLQQDQDPEENLNSAINSNDSTDPPKIKSGILQNASHSTIRVLKILLPTRNTGTKLGSKSLAKDPIKESGKGKNKSLILPETSHWLQSVGNSRTNFMAHQPFALATDNRASSLVGFNPVDIEVTRAKERPNHTANLARSRNHHMKEFHMGEVLAKTEQRSSSSKILHGETSKKSRKTEHEDKQAEGPPSEARSSPNPSTRKGKVYQVQPNARNTFSLSSNVRAEKRKEFNLKMEARMIAKDVEKNQVQAKTKEEIASEIKELRKSLNFKAAPMPGFYQQEAPSLKKDIKKIPLTRPKSPKLGRKGSESMAMDLHSVMESVQKFEGLGRVKGPLKGVSEGGKFEHYIEASQEGKGHWNGGLVSDSILEGIGSMRSRGIVHSRPRPSPSVNIETIDRDSITTRNVSTIKERNASNIKERTVSNFKERNVCNGKERGVSNFKEGNVSNVNEIKFSDDIEERNVSNIRDRSVSNLKERTVSDIKERNVSNIRYRSVSNLKERSASNLKDRSVSNLEERNLSNIKERTASNVKDRNVSNIKERGLSNIKERNAANVKEGNVSNMKERSLSNIKERNLSNVKERSISNMRERNVSNVKEGNVSNLKERNPKTSKEVAKVVAARPASQRRGTVCGSDKRNQVGGHNLLCFLLNEKIF